MYTAKHEFFIGIDSDGCVFDTMELKQKECFVPNTVRHWGLKGISKYARETIEFVNLYSKSRGCNRFLALVEVLDLLRQRPEVRARGVDVEVPKSLRDWIGRESALGNPALKKEIERTNDRDLIKTLAWSEDVNTTIDLIVEGGVPPFPFVRECLEKMSPKADLLVVSATPHDALVREWVEQELNKYVAAIGGQEFGTKAESLALAQKEGKYTPDKMLMIGDAVGDYNAAQANQVLFFPINPGQEEKSWEQLYKEGLDRFFDGTFDGQYQEGLLQEFNKLLPDKPSWPVLES